MKKKERGMRREKVLKESMRCRIGGLQSLSNPDPTPLTNG
jgi:hypothetical protein